MKLSRLLLMFLALILFAGATTGEIYAQDQTPKDKKTEKQDDDDDDDDKYESPEMQKKLAKKARISKKEAKRIALERVPGRVIESEIDKEKGRLVWEFEIKTRENKVFEVLVDAKTGEIVEVEEETDEDDDDTENLQAKTKKSGKWYKFWKKIPLLKKL